MEASPVPTKKGRIHAASECHLLLLVSLNWDRDNDNTSAWCCCVNGKYSVGGGNA